MTDTDQTAWLEWRRHGIGASDVAATKANIYGGATKAVATKLGHDTNDITPELAARGKRWEPVIAAGIHAHTGYHIAGAQTQLEHPTHPIYRCTPDGFLLTTPSGRISDAAGGCEIKTKGPSAPWQWTYWHAQCQWSMLVAQLPRWYLAIATIDEVFDEITGNLTEQITDTKYRWIYADQVAQTELIDIANQLWAWVQAGELPPATGPDALPYVKEAHKVADPDATANIDDLADLIERHELLKAAAKTAVAEAKTAEAQIRERMGTATEALTTDGQWRVRCGTPIFKFTDWSERDFIELHCIHGDDCAPDCTTHRPDLLQPTLCRDEAKAEMPDEYDAARYPTTDRRLTTKRMETQ